MKTKILGTGLTGLVGSRIVELLKDTYEFENLSFESGIDITNKEQVQKAIIASPAGVVLHLAAKADVDGCEKDKPLGKDGDAWRINVEGTRNIVEACKRDNKRIIYISTDFVFDGENPPAGGYTEEDTPNPINWYAVTKHEGEKVVQGSGLPCLICRLAFPYRANFPLKKDLVRAIIDKLTNGEKLAMVTDEVITPTFIDDVAIAINGLIQKQATGIYHVVGSSSHTPVEIGHLIAQVFSLDQSLVSKTTREAYFSGRAARPWKLALKNDKLRKLGVKMSTLKEGLEKIKSQFL